MSLSRRGTAFVFRIFAAAAIVETLILVACGGDDSSSNGGSTPDAGASGTSSGGNPGADAQRDKDASSGNGDASNVIDDASSDGGTPSDGDASEGGAGVTCTVSPCVLQVATGFDFACAVMSDKSVRCWGGNYYGQTGQPNVGGGAVVLAPTSVTGIGPAAQVAAGTGHACALLEDQTVWCWGDDQYAQLAQPTDAKAPLPTPTPQKVALPVKPIAQLIGAGYSTCVRFTDGTLSCWGSNNTGQTGEGVESSPFDNSRVTITPTTQAGGVTGAIDSNMGWRFVCSLFEDGGVSCFGNNYDGQLGRGIDAGGLTDLGTHPTAGHVIGLPAPVVNVPHSSGYHEIVLLSTGQAFGWGENKRGELGLGADAASQATPQSIPTLTGVLEVAPSNISTCALTATRKVVCFGARDWGELGTYPDAGPDASKEQYEPVEVPGVSDVVQVSPGWFYYACALERTGTLKCWGNNEYGQLGRNQDAGALAFDPNPAPVAF
jgi:alpha-tubulin suppressor-like RCC1 family protein